MTSPPEPSRRPVPLRRLKTNRFKTLAQRNNDNARRRARYAVNKQPEGGAVDWDDIREVHDDVGLSWGQIEAIMVTRRDLSRDYLAGVDIGDRGKIFWTSRLQYGPDVPDSLFYYRGYFG